MAALPYMPLYVADYLADTAHLTAMENGAYLLLIMNYWQRGKALPSEPAHLARICRLSGKQFAKIISQLENFFEVDGNTWVHHRIEKELAKVRDKSAKASNAGKASAQQRSNVRSTDVQQTFNHTDTDTDTDTDTRKNISSGQSPDQLPEGFEDFWEAYPKRDGSADRKGAVKAYRKALKTTDEKTILEGALAYAADCAAKNKIGTEYVKQARTWLNADGWSETYGRRDTEPTGQSREEVLNFLRS